MVVLMIKQYTERKTTTNYIEDFRKNAVSPAKECVTAKL
jgi:hypothetical protein